MKLKHPLTSPNQEPVYVDDNGNEINQEQPKTELPQVPVEEIKETETQEISETPTQEVNEISQEPTQEENNPFKKKNKRN